VRSSDSCINVRRANRTDLLSTSYYFLEYTLTRIFRISTYNVMLRSPGKH